MIYLEDWSKDLVLLAAILIPLHTHPLMAPNKKNLWLNASRPIETFSLNSGLPEFQHLLGLHCNIAFSALIAIAFSRIERHCWIVMQSVLTELQHLPALVGLYCADWHCPRCNCIPQELQGVVLHCGALSLPHSSTLSTGQLGSSLQRNALH